MNGITVGQFKVSVRWEVMEQLLVLFVHVDIFLHWEEIGSPVTTASKLSEYSYWSKQKGVQ